MSNTTRISAIVPVGDRYDDSGDLAREYLKALEQMGRDFELVFVLDGKRIQLAKTLTELAGEDARLRIIQLTKSFGEATALSAGLEITDGEIVLSLPAYYQVDGAEIGKLLSELDNCDMAFCRVLGHSNLVSVPFHRCCSSLSYFLVLVLSGRRVVNGIH